MDEGVQAPSPLEEIQMDIGKKNKNKIKKRVIRNPMESFFLGGFDMLPKTTQNRVLKQLNLKNKSKGK